MYVAWINDNSEKKMSRGIKRDKSFNESDLFVKCHN